MKKIKVAFTIDEDILKWADRVSKEKRVTRSAFVNHVLWVLKKERLTLDRDIVFK